MNVTFRVLCLFSVFMAVLTFGCSLANQSQTRAGHVANSTADSKEIDSESKLIAKIVWEETVECSVEATLKNARALLKDLPEGVPKHQLEVKELRTGKVLLRQAGVETSLSMELAKDPVEGGRILFTSAAAGSADVLKIFLVNCDGAKEVFSGAYRDFYTYLQFYERNSSRLTVFTADNLTEFDNALMVEKWDWSNGSFSSAGIIPYKDFIDLFDRSLTSRKSLTR